MCEPQKNTVFGISYGSSMRTTRECYAQCATCLMTLSCLPPQFSYSLWKHFCNRIMTRY